MLSVGKITSLTFYYCWQFGENFYTRKLGPCPTVCLSGLRDGKVIYVKSRAQTQFISCLAPVVWVLN